MNMGNAFNYLTDPCISLRFHSLKLFGPANGKIKLLLYDGVRGPPVNYISTLKCCSPFLESISYSISNKMVSISLSNCIMKTLFDVGGISI